MTYRFHHQNSIKILFLIYIITQNKLISKILRNELFNFCIFLFFLDKHDFINTPNLQKEEGESNTTRGLNPELRIKTCDLPKLGTGTRNYGKRPETKNLQNTYKLQLQEKNLLHLGEKADKISQSTPYYLHSLDS